MSTTVLPDNSAIKYSRTQATAHNHSMAARPDSRDTLARNLRRLMTAAGWTERDVANHAKISQKAVNKILNSASTARLDTVNAIAGAFGLAGWHLIMPNLPDELLGSPRLAKLVDGYIGAPPEARDFVDQVISRELSRR